jgi:two-component system response regulator FixJ
LSTCRAEPLPLSAPLVCLVDPDPATQRDVHALFATLGAEVRVYGNAREFLASLPREVPVCVIAESRLPDLTGLALLQELRARGLSMPTILLSSAGDVTGAVAAMRAGALDFVEKPFIDRVLVSLVAPILNLDARRGH